MLMRLLKIGWIAAFAVAVASYPLAALLSSSSTEVLLVAPHSPEGVTLNRDLWELDHPGPATGEEATEVIRLYGNSGNDPVEVVFVDEHRFLHPEELPSLTLLPVDKQKGENPLQVQTLYFFAQIFLIGGSTAGVVLLALSFWLRRKGRTIQGIIEETPGVSRGATSTDPRDFFDEFSSP